MLSDQESVWIDNGGISVAYFCKNKPVRVDQAVIEELKNIASTLGDRNVRLCLHESPEANFHDMVIFERSGRYYRPHKHHGNGESFHIIEGKMAVFGFDDSGNITDACLMEAHSNVMYRTGPDMYHTTVPLSDFVIYHEARPGPFIRNADNILAPWAPDGSDAQEVADFRDSLLIALEDN